ncbi:hypothetical protein SAU060112_40504 [Staphylococcus aureus]|nr:hypothetical protein SAU060112_40504 [Staphylococcus aureus]
MMMLLLDYKKAMIETMVSRFITDRFGYLKLGNIISRTKI